MGSPITKLTIEGFKSIRELKNFELRPLNVLIGANGSGKSNFIAVFKMLQDIFTPFPTTVDEFRAAVQRYVSRAGGANMLLHMGSKTTACIRLELRQGKYSWDWVFEAAEPDRLHINEIMLMAYNWRIYHFHDTSSTALMRKRCGASDYEYLRPDAANLAAFLFRLKHQAPASYEKIRGVVRIVAPFFDDFRLERMIDSENQIQLEWYQKGSGNLFYPNQLSDGTLRFICLATALLQPELPPIMLFDEPELGLHPYALNLLAAMLQSAAVSSQIIVSTQSSMLLDEFEPEDVVVVDRVGDESTFKRLDTAELTDWLKDYSLGELWRKNVLEGGPA